MKIIIVLAAVLTFAVTLQAQNPTTEQEWRSELAKARHQYSSATSSMWGSAVLAGGGGALMLVGVTHEKECVTGSLTGTTSTGQRLVCDQYKTVADWRFLGPGMGLAATGAILTHVFSIRQGKAAEHKRNLEEIGKQRNWSVSLRPNGATIAFSW